MNQIYCAAFAGASILPKRSNSTHWNSGQLICEFQGYRANSLKNQIIRSTLARLVKVGQFGPEPARVREMQQKLRRLLRDLDGIDFIELTPDLIRRQLYARGGYDHDYRLMLSICDLIIQRQIPSDMEGHRTAIVPLIDRELLVLYTVYERFVANFYRLHLRGWEVSCPEAAGVARGRSE